MDVSTLFTPAAQRRPTNSDSQHNSQHTSSVAGLDVQHLFQCGRCSDTQGSSSTGDRGKGLDYDSASRSCSDAAELEEEDALDEEEEDEDMDEQQEGTGVPAVGTGVRLWDSSILHPNGVRNWKDVPNCDAALRYECPCGKKCLSHVRDAIQLYEFRRCLRVQAAQMGQGGLRDAVPAHNAHNAFFSIQCF